MEALEAEQKHIDNRAGVVERKLRQLLETGGVHRLQMNAQHIKTILILFNIITLELHYSYLGCNRGH